MKEFFITSSDGYALSAMLFEVENPKAIIQIVHGMEEHKERYIPFISFLNENGFNVLITDLRGHGKNAIKLGYFNNHHGYKNLIEDQRIITNYIKSLFPGLKIYLFAHSFGTIITRCLLQTDSIKYDKVILSGYPCYQSASHIGVFISSLIKLFKGPEYFSKFLQNLSVGNFNKSIKNPRTEVDWLSKNDKNVDEYIKDPYCGIGFRTSAFNDLYHLVIQMHKYKNAFDINKELPILLLRGKEDPCTGFDKGAKDSFNTLNKTGFLNIKHIEYNDMRHEILNEQNKEMVYKDVLNFYN